MTEQQIKEYLSKYYITNKESLAKHIMELKRNTRPNTTLISELVMVLEDEENLFFSLFSAEKNGGGSLNNHALEIIQAEIEKVSQQNDKITSEALLSNPKIEGLFNSTRHKSLNGETHKNINYEFKKCSPQCFCDGSCKKQKYNFGLTEQISTITENLECINKNHDTSVSMKDSWDYACDELKNNFSDIVDWQMKRGKIFNYDKDDVITNSSRGEKETMEHLQGVKETEGKLDYSEINLEILDLMAKRFNDNKHRYPKGNMKKPLDKSSLVWASFRHVRKMLQPIKDDTETFNDHLTAVLCNMSMILDQQKLENE